MPKLPPGEPGDTPKLPPPSPGPPRRLLEGAAGTAADLPRFWELLLSTIASCFAIAWKKGEEGTGAALMQAGEEGRWLFEEGALMKPGGRREANPYSVLARPKQHAS